MRVLATMLICLGAVLGGFSAEAAEQPARIRALLITGDDVPAHPWQEMAEATREALDAAGRVQVRVSEDPLILESKAALERYDVIMMLMYNRHLPTITDQAKENLLEFVRGGKGFYVQHLASASFAEWDEYGKLCGRYWVMGTSGHGPRKTFTATIADDDHPITKGMESFTTDDELYARLQGDTEIQVLVTAESSWSNQVEPLVFVHKYGEGRVAHNAFGHDGKALRNPPVARIIARAVEWAATGAVAD
jgi:type 1 glutamine amidotransferase